MKKRKVLSPPFPPNNPLLKEDVILKRIIKETNGQKAEPVKLIKTKKFLKNKKSRVGKIWKARRALEFKVPASIILHKSKISDSALYNDHYNNSHPLKSYKGFLNSIKRNELIIILDMKCSSLYGEEFYFYKIITSNSKILWTCNFMSIAKKPRSLENAQKDNWLSLFEEV